MNADQSPGRGPSAVPEPASTDITGRDDIAGIVREFYGKAFRDRLLGPVFTDIAKMDLAAHMPIMCDFWQTALLRAGLYHRNALHPHIMLNAKVTLTPAHFTRWLELWNATVDERHVGEKAELAKDQARRIAASLQRRLGGQHPGELMAGPILPTRQ